MRLGQPSVAGELDVAIVRRYLKRNLPKLTACYEEELAARPVLEGTVTFAFTIDRAGKVSASRADGIDPAVSSCMAAVIGRIEFPKPKDGSPVTVSYPFTFRPPPDGAATP